MKKITALLTLVFCILFTCKTSAQNDILKAQTQMRNFFYAQQWDSAIFYAKKTQELAKVQFGDLSSINAQMLLAVGLCYMQLGDFAGAYPYLKNCARISKLIDRTDSAENIQCLAFLGYVCSEMGAYSEGEMYLLQCVDISGKTGDRSMLNDTRLYLAIIYDNLGN
jgi:tetratricopeptide (TPR) repeat protein